MDKAQARRGASRSRRWIRTLSVVMSVSVAAVGVAAVAAPVAQAAAGAPVEPITPTRLLDTRDRTDAHAGKKAAFELVALRVGGRAGLPANPAAVALNVTVTAPDGAGYVTVWPCDVARPNTSNLNFTAGASVANAVIVQVPVDAAVCLAASVSAHLIADVTGWFPAGAVQAITPLRLADTRNPADPVAGKKAAFEEMAVVVAGRPGIAADAAAVAVNVTVTESDGPGYVTVWPCGQARPLASNLNFVASQTVANLVVAALGSGALCAAASTAAHILVDATAYFAPGTVAPMVPTRLADTRQAGTPKPAGVSLAVPVAGHAGVAGNARAAMVNVTVTEPDAAGFVTVWPCSQSRPNASSLNFTAGQTVAGAVLAGLTTSTMVCVAASATAHLVVDVTAWFPTPAPILPPTQPPTTPPTTPTGGAPPAIPGPQPSSPPQTGPHAYLDDGTDADHARWNPCQQIRYVVNDTLTTPAARAELDDALADIEHYTGLDFVNAGQTTTGYDTATPGKSPLFQPPAGAEAIFVFSDEAHSPQLNGSLVGIGGARMQSTDGTTWWSITGGAIFETIEDPAQMGALIRHEIGHMVGLGHIGDPAQIMYHQLLPGMALYGPGDIEGLWWLGAAQGCRPAARNDTMGTAEQPPTVSISDS